MNRIILIGNGFDLAHGMQTSYKHFIDDYYKNICDKIKKNQIYSFKNNDLEINIDERLVLDAIIPNKYHYEILREHWKDKVIIKKSKNSFLDHISDLSDLSLENWVDIEREYYEELLQIQKDYKDRGDINKQAKKLNNELKSIEKSLEEYLTKEDEKYKNSTVIGDIYNSIYSKIEYENIAIRSRNAYCESIVDKFNKITDESYVLSTKPKAVPGKEISFNPSKAMEYKNRKQKENALPRSSILNAHAFVEDIENNKLPDYFSYPQDMIFVSFNYTNTAIKYAKHESDIIHIHGKLNDNENSIIFGYGDEIADEYKLLEEAHDNELTKNNKANRHLETGNYRKVLDFIEKDLYQIFIMGHSCGCSDRTLLNKLFEHDNCASIKTFFHDKGDGNNNFSEIISSMARNFKDKSLMRDVVVNKGFCKPLIEKKNGAL